MISFLDCTHRDGGYLNGFSFTSEETYELSAYLSSCKIPFIEVGHGLGLGASGAKFGYARESDQQYILDAVSGAGLSSIGAFAIPSVATIDDIKSCIECGMQFIRVGCSPNDFSSCRDFVRSVVDLPLKVYVNLMKTYTLPVVEIFSIVSELLDLGIDGFYVVDSAGCMLPRDINACMDSLSSLNSNMQFGFHGHNNLGMALATSLEAVQCGANMIDTTVGGIGRMGGNTQFEVFCKLCRLSQIQTGLEEKNIRDPHEVLCEELLCQSPYIRHIQYTLGAAGIHSSSLPMIEEIAQKKGISADRIIALLGSYERINPTVELTELIVDTLLLPFEKFKAG